MKLEGKVTIHRIHSNKVDEDWIEITAEDNKSQVECIRIKIDLKTFANIITGHSYQPCEIEFNDSGKVGKTIEFKEMEIWVPMYTCVEKEKIKEFLKIYEKDGWIPTLNDAANWQRTVKNEKHLNQEGRIQKVGFVRLV